MQKSDYRPDIEGLRAIAILAVVVCHARIPYFEGGFVGVDIFFVLSGYLITGLLVKEINATGKVNFLSFYARRFKRLLPGLVLMLLVSSLIAAVVLSPLEQPSHAYSGQAAFLWMSNFYFAISNAGYFEAGSAGNLFLHTWSLGVEEQFYLIWPVLLLTIISSGKHLLKSLVVIFASCLALSIFLSYSYPLWGFYSMPSRGWQFALGGIVYVLVAGGPASKHNATAGRALAGYSGAALVLASILLIDEQMTYPGYAALLPSIGTALILYAKDSSTSKALSAYPLQAIGRVSYSWYLWHWPVLLLGGMLFNRQDIVFQLLLVAASLAIAVVAYSAVENPIRRSAFKPGNAVLASALVMISGVVFANVWIKKVPEWAQAPELAIYQAAMMDMPQIYRAECDSWYTSSAVDACQYGNPDAENTVVLFGDSVLAQWFSAFARIYGDQGWSLTVLTKSACPIVDEPIHYDRAGGEYKVCEEWRNLAIDYLKELKPDLIFMGSSATYGFADETWISGTRRILASLSEVSGKVYIVRGTPRLTFDSPSCLAKGEWQPERIAELSGCQSAETTDPDNQVLAALQKAVGPFENAAILDFNDLVCPDDICKARIGDQIVFRDTAHITDKFVRSITPQIREKIAEAQ